MFHDLLELTASRSVGRLSTFIRANVCDWACAVLCAGDSCYVDRQYQTCVQGNWQQQQQFQPVTNIRADYAKPLTTRKSRSCQPSDRVVTAAEHLLALASAQTTAESRGGLANCQRSNSRDSGLGKDSDSGSSTGSNIPTASQSSNVLSATQMSSVDGRYVKGGLQSERHSASTSQPSSDHLVCAVLPMRNVAANQSDSASRCPTTFQSVQHASALHYFNRSKHPRMTLPPSLREPELTEFSCRDGKLQYCGQRFPVSHNVPSYYPNMVINPSLHCRGYRRVGMESTGQLSQFRGGLSGQSVRCTVAGISSTNCAGRVAAAADAVDSGFVVERHPAGARGGTSTFASVLDRHVRSSQLVPADDLLYDERQSRSYRPPIESYHNNVDTGRYQQSYQPYAISVDVQRHSNSAVLPHAAGGGRNAFYHTSPRGLVQFRLND